MEQLAQIDIIQTLEHLSQVQDSARCSQTLFRQTGIPFYKAPFPLHNVQNFAQLPTTERCLSLQSLKQKAATVWRKLDLQLYAKAKEWVMLDEFFFVDVYDTLHFDNLLHTLSLLPEQQQLACPFRCGYVQNPNCK